MSVKNQLKSRVGVVLALVAAGVVLAAPAPKVWAASITVNTAADIAPDINGNFPNDNLCSLRAAIRSAQNNSNAQDVNCSTGAPVANVLDTITIAPSLAGQTMTLNPALGAFDTISR